MDQAGATVSGPIELMPNPNFSGGFTGTDVQAFGRTDLTINARVRTGGADGTEVDFLITSPDTVRPSRKSLLRKTSLGSIPDNRTRRMRFVERWTELREKSPTVLEAWACLLQDMADTDLETFGLVAQLDDMIIDDMVDIFVPSTYFDTTLMQSDPVIPDPPHR